MSDEKKQECTQPPRLRYYLDTEFYEDGKTIDLISIALVCEDGRELYLMNREAELHRVSDWVRANVLPHLPKYGDPRWVTRKEIASALSFFTDRANGRKPEFWAYYADCDWVVLCQLFGTMMDLPKHFPMFCMDLKQLSVMKGSPEHPKPNPKEEHDALADAHWNRNLHTFLEAVQS